MNTQLKGSTAVKKKIVLGLLSAMLLFTASCSSSKSSTEPTDPPAAATPDKSDTDGPPADPAGPTTTSPPDKQDDTAVDHPATDPAADPATTPAPAVPPGFEYPDAVRGIYVTGWSAGGEKMQSLLKLVDDTELNAMVIDIKDDDGYITFRPEGDMADFGQPYIRDPEALMKTLQEHHIYPIARIVAFKDSVLAKKQPERSYVLDGKVWRNGNGDGFINPFSQPSLAFKKFSSTMFASLKGSRAEIRSCNIPWGNTRIRSRRSLWSRRKNMPKLAQSTRKG
jgi:hypothetical protein